MIGSVEVLPRGGGLRAAIALARVEAREAVRHPVLIGFGALSLLFLGLAVTGFGESNAGEDEAFLFLQLAGYTCLPLAAGAFVAANLGASRTQRSRTAEMLEPAPLGATWRTAAHLHSTLAAGAIAVLFVVVTLVVTGSSDGVSVALVDGRRQVTPSLAELMQGPLVVVWFGVLGVAVARWVPRAEMALVMLASLVPQMIAISWMLNGSGWWLAPMTHGLHVVRWVEVSPQYGYPVLEQVPAAAMPWHLAYLLGAAVAIGSLALLRSGRARSVKLAAAAGLGLALLAGAMQVVSLGG